MLLIIFDKFGDISDRSDSEHFFVGYGYVELSFDIAHEINIPPIVIMFFYTRTYIAIVYTLYSDKI